MPFCVSEEFRRREVSFHGLRENEGWRIKIYGVRYAEGPIDWPAYDEGLRLSAPPLPHYAVAVFRVAVVDEFMNRHVMSFSQRRKWMRR